MAHLATIGYCSIASSMVHNIVALRQEVAACSGDLVGKDPKFAEQPKLGEKTQT